MVLNFKDINRKAEEWARCTDPVEKQKLYTELIMVIFNEAQKCSGQNEFLISGSKDETKVKTETETEEDESEDESDYEGGGEDSDNYKNKGSLPTTRKSFSFMGIDNCNLDAVADALLAALGPGNGKLPRTAFNPDKKTLFTSYLISLIRRKMSDRFRKDAKDSCESQGREFIKYSDIKFKELGLAEGAVIEWDNRPNIKITVCDVESNTVLYTEGDLSTIEKSFIEVLKTDEGETNEKKLMHFRCNGKRLSDMMDIESYIVPGDFEGAVEAGDDEEYSIVVASKLNELDYNDIDSIIEFSNFILSAIKMQEKVRKDFHFKGIYSWVIIILSRSYKDFFKELDNYTDILFEPADMDFIKKMTTFTSGNFTALSNSEYSDYAKENGFIFKDNGLLKEIALYTYYDAKQSTMHGHIKKFWEAVEHFKSGS